MDNWKDLLIENPFLPTRYLKQQFPDFEKYDLDNWMRKPSVGAILNLDEWKLSKTGMNREKARRILKSLWKYYFCNELNYDFDNDSDIVVKLLHTKIDRNHPLNSMLVTSSYLKQTGYAYEDWREKGYTNISFVVFHLFPGKEWCEKNFVNPSLFLQTQFNEVKIKETLFLMELIWLRHFKKILSDDSNNKIETAKKITHQEAKSDTTQNNAIYVPDLAKDLLEQISFEARESEYIDAKSGISARMSITAYENLLSTAERRCLVIGEKKTAVRLSDFMGVIPSITGKVELVYEGEQEGAGNVALSLIGDAVKTLFLTSFPKIEKLEKEGEKTPYTVTLEWFFNESGFELMDDASEKLYKTTLDDVLPLNELLDTYKPDLDKKDRYFWKEIILWGLVEFDKLTKSRVDEGYQFKDTYGSFFSNL